jgi:hypothetical protein
MKSIVVNALAWIIDMIERAIRLGLELVYAGILLAIAALWWIVFGGPLIGLTP